jgi:HEAT repeat protein
MAITLEDFLKQLEEQRDDPRTVFYDASSIIELSEEAQVKAEERLLVWSAAEDSRAVEALPFVTEERAIALLESLRGTGNTWFRASVIRTLARVRGDANDIEQLQDSLQQLDPVERTLAAYSIKQSEKTSAIAPLLDLLDDPSASVRVHAQEGLVQKLGLTPFDEPRQSPLRSMQLAGMCALSTVWPSAQLKLRRVFEACLNGASPDELDLVYRGSENAELAEIFWQALADESTPLPLELVSAMGQHDRAWLEAVLMVRLFYCDPRSPNALMTLEADGLNVHLREAIAIADTSEHNFIGAAEAVLERIP